MKKYPDFEYDTNKDQFEGEDVPMLDGDWPEASFGSWYFLHVKTEDQCGPAIVDMFKRPLVIWYADVGHFTLQRTMLQWYGSTNLSSQRD
ncbi:hypothetical protein ARMGADRAFT_292212 [Armillaria gallica]|uniref:Uncharacterized protein n=1 Tax=Armillaria gallica TaxID=47427 RepID=A0A2H3D671_ARMGA|nr:hypothetical protein ARMGADRAFT_292212 [Armillaria gallica]